ncbi:MAG: DUF1501 domain-containing protein [bacterium]|nr:DUF1501 domain-containing protein [bacterium]
MTNLDRRDLMRLALGGLASGSLLSAASPLRAMAAASALAPPVASPEKVLVIFMRGGTDGVLALVPHGDTTYDAMRDLGANPPYLSDNRVIGLTAFAGLNDRMAWLANGAGSPWSAGQLALVHQVGNATGQRSHFTEQARFETAELLDAAALPEAGFLARLSSMIGLPGTTAVGTASVSTAMQRMFQSSTNPQLHLRNVPAFQTGTFDPALIAHLSGTPAGAQEAVVDAIGDLMVAAQAEIATPAVVHNGALFPQSLTEWNSINWNGPFQNPARYFKFFEELEGAMHLLAETDCRVAGVELGAFDTHANAFPLLDELLEVIAFAMRSAWDLAQSSSLPLTTATFSEFGRAAQANLNGGTDHGLGGVAFLQGPRVKGGVVNCDASSWTDLGVQAGLAQNAVDWNAVPVRTHFLAIQQEMIDKLYGVTSFARQSIVLPGLPAIAGTPAAQQIGFLT